MNNADKPIHPIVNEQGYPYMNSNFQEEHNNPPPKMTTQGLTKREYFAGVALQGILSNRWSMEFGNYNEKAKAEMAIKQADELLKQLENK
ncbi:hypothetical protein J2X97_000378 [Epilithonimonas hungarica]|uniref:hypothetical protein n=1 Tax=Epilithonimonas hungarica TaxID=454006 RepID=UPI002786D85E|nr:hypothetical protein [Epilithonimonas hungarica]MDP9954741.1 hypothetical protein [Epilithonimonas hungarica]